MVSKAIERAQNTVEQQNAEIRKNVLKYDEVMNEQRKVIYALRDQILDEADLREKILERVPGRGGRGARRHLLRGRLPRGVGPRRAPRRGAHLLAVVAHHRAARRGVGSTDELYELLVDDAIDALREARERARRRRDAPGRAPGDAPDHRHEVARAPLRDGLPAGGHQPAGDGPEGPAHRVAARGLRDVRADDEGHRPGPRAATSCTCRSPCSSHAAAPASARTSRRAVDRRRRARGAEPAVLGARRPARRRRRHGRGGPAGRRRGRPGRRARRGGRPSRRR